MLSKRATERLTGFLLGASVFLMLAHIVVDVALGHGRASTFLVLLYGFPTALAGPALYITLRRHEPTLAMFSGFCFAGHGLLIVLTAVILLVGLQFPAEFALYGAESSSLAGIASPLELTMDKIGKSAYAFLGLGLSLVGLLILMSRALQRWIGWLGFAVGISGFLMCLAALADIFARDKTEVLVGVAILANLVFMLILGFRFVLRDTQGERATLPILERAGSKRPRNEPEGPFQRFQEYARSLLRCL